MSVFATEPVTPKPSRNFPPPRHIQQYGFHCFLLLFPVFVTFVWFRFDSCMCCFQLLFFQTRYNFCLQSDVERNIRKLFVFLSIVLCTVDKSLCVFLVCYSFVFPFIVFNSQHVQTRTHATIIWPIYQSTNVNTLTQISVQKRPAYCSRRSARSPCRRRSKARASPLE